MKISFLNFNIIFFYKNHSQISWTNKSRVFFTIFENCSKKIWLKLIFELEFLGFLCFRLLSKNWKWNNNILLIFRFKFHFDKENLIKIVFAWKFCTCLQFYDLLCQDLLKNLKFWLIFIAKSIKKLKKLLQWIFCHQFSKNVP